MSEIVLKNDYIVLPVKLVEEVFPSTNATFIKVYMHIAMLSAKRKNIDLLSVANDLQLLESDVLQAVRYWASCGALEYTEHSAAAVTLQYSDELSEVVMDIEDNPQLAEMLQLAQEVLGKTISSSEMQTLYWIHGELGFSPEVVLMLLEYCVSIGKKSMQYIERVATAWHSKGITTIDEVERFLAEEETTKNYMNSLKSVFGIRDRAFTGIEEDFLKKWHDDYKMSEEMIALAYEYCILRTNKLSFPYIDKIISDWNEKNIRTIEAAEIENEKFKNNKPGNSAMPGYDYKNNDLEMFTWGQTDE